MIVVIIIVVTRQLQYNMTRGLGRGKGSARRDGRFGLHITRFRASAALPGSTIRCHCLRRLLDRRIVAEAVIRGARAAGPAQPCLAVPSDILCMCTVYMFTHAYVYTYIRIRLPIRQGLCFKRIRACAQRGSSVNKKAKHLHAGDPGCMGIQRAASR